MTEAAVERLSPVGADAKSLRREAKRGYALALDGAAVKPEPASAESPTKKHMSEKPKSSKSTATSAASAAAAKKKAAARHHEVAELQGVVAGIQQQVDVASKGIQELKELVHSHLVTRMAPSNDWSAAATTATAMTAPVTCVSPPASLMALGDQDEDEQELGEFPGLYHPDALVYYGGEPMPFSC